MISDCRQPGIRFAIDEVGVYSFRDGRTHVPMTLAVGEAVIVALDLSNPGDSLHAVSTTADAVASEDGKGYAIAVHSGAFQTTLSDGTVVDSTVGALPATIALDTWNIVIEDWNEGEKVVNLEEKFGHVTREVYFATKKDEP